MNTRLVSFVFLVYAVPGVAAAQTVSQFFGLFNAVAGVMLVVAVLLFFGGFIEYLSKFGTLKRAEGLDRMGWGVTTLFVLVVMLGIIGWIQRFFA